MEKIKKIFEKYTTDYHFYLKDLRSGQEYELGTKKRYPICSCFKLAVLMAFFDSLKSEEELFEEVVIAPEAFSPGGGIINYFTTPVKFTYFQLAQMMMAFSDSTATDFLISKIGIIHVNEYLQDFSDTSPLKGNLREMLTFFDSQRGQLNLKEANSVESLNTTISLIDFGYSNAVDLANLSKRTADYNNKKYDRYFETCFKSKRSQPRINLFFEDELIFYGKTGSLGFGFYSNDCGILIDKYTQSQNGIVGICSNGWKIEKDEIEAVFGVIGKLCIEQLQLKPKFNRRWSSLVEKHILRNVIE